MDKVMDVLSNDLIKYIDKLESFKQYKVNSNCNKVWKRTPRKIKKKFGKIYNCVHLSKIKGDVSLTDYYFWTIIYLEHYKAYTRYISGDLGDIHIDYLKTL